MGEQDFAQYMDLSEYQLNYVMMNSGLRIEAESFLAMIKSWQAGEDECGAYVSHGEYKVDVKGDEIVVSTEAEYEDVEKAYNAGYTHAAQLYNSMPGFHKRREYKYEGTVESVLLIDDMSTEIIADGKHLPGTILKLVYKLKGVEKLSLVTAALSYAAYEGEIPESDNIFIEDGVCKLKKDKSLVGSIATMDTLVKTMVQKADVPLMDAIRMASETPAKVMGILDRTGTLEEGKEANVVLMNDKLDVTSVWLKGTRVK
jgi:N-acetylglucosamine-6-phosphate deacetylase